MIKTLFNQQADCLVVLIAVRDRTDGQFQLARTVAGGDGSFIPLARYLDVGAAVRAGLHEAERSGARFLGVAR